MVELKRCEDKENEFYIRWIFNDKKELGEENRILGGQEYVIEV